MPLIKWSDITSRLNDPHLLQAGLAILSVLVLILWLKGQSWRRERNIHQAAQISAADRITLLEAQTLERGEVVRTLEMTAIKTEARIENQASRLSELGEERDGLADALHLSRQQMGRLQTDLAEANMRGSKNKEIAAREIANLRELREEMTGQFRLLSSEALRVQRSELQKTQDDQLTALLHPFRDQVHRFQNELQSRNKVLDEEGARLREQIASLYQRTEDMSREAVNLTRALKGEKQRQGAWGEMILERLLEESGLSRGIHYEVQASWQDDDGRRWRPDVVVRMPREKVLVIDSKVSLNDYETAVNCEDQVAAQAALRRHISAVRAHIIALSEKGYQRMNDASVDYVLMFIPIEGAFSEALRADPDLAKFAMDRRIGLTTPTTLMLTLRTVDHIWAVERRETNALAIATRAGQLYDKVSGFVDSMEGVGRALDQANRAHGQAMDRLTRGSGNVIRQVEKLRELGARAQKRIELDHDGEDQTDLNVASETDDLPAELEGNDG